MLTATRLDRLARTRDLLNTLVTITGKAAARPDWDGVKEGLQWRLAETSVARPATLLGTHRTPQHYPHRLQEKPDWR
jgi:hypothetical protein